MSSINTLQDILEMSKLLNVYSRAIEGWNEDRAAEIDVVDTLRRQRHEQKRKISTNKTTKKHKQELKEAPAAYEPLLLPRKKSVKKIRFKVVFT